MVPEEQGKRIDMSQNTVTNDSWLEDHDPLTMPGGRYVQSGAPRKWNGAPVECDYFAFALLNE